MIILSPEISPWQLQVVNLGEIRILQGKDASYGIFESAVNNREIAIYAPAPQSRDVFVNSTPSTSECPFIIFPGNQFIVRTLSPSKYTIITINHEYLKHSLDNMHVIDDIYFPRTSQPLPFESTRRIQFLARRVLQIDLHDPATFADERKKKSVIRLFLSEIKLFFETISLPLTHKTRRRMDPLKIANTAASFIESNLGNGIYVPDVSEFIGISQRHLNSIFHEVYGISVVKYMKMLRLSLIRKSIRSSRNFSSIAKICSDHGVWDFGRFSAEYKKTYGVLPSHDSRRHPQ